MIRHDRVIVTGHQPPEMVAGAGVPSVLVAQACVGEALWPERAVLATRETFADAIIELLADPAAAKALGERARANAARHTPQAFAAATLDLYGKFVACGRTRSATPARADAAHSAA